MKCENCGCINEEDAFYCEQCGAILADPRPARNFSGLKAGWSALARSEKRRMIVVLAILAVTPILCLTIGKVSEKIEAEKPAETETYVIAEEIQTGVFYEPESGSETPGSLQ